MLVDRCAVFDNLSHRLRIWASVHLPLHGSVEEAYRTAMERADTLAEALQRPLPPQPPAPELGGLEDGWDARLRGGGRARPRVHRRRRLLPGRALPPLSADYRAEPFDAVPRAPHASTRRPTSSICASATDALVGASPEILVRVEGETGRRSARSPGPARAARREAEDRRSRTSSSADPKERAEHVMLVDLGRNDVGRVAAPGTVKVTER